MSLSVRFGSTFHVSAKPVSHKQPLDLEPHVNELPGYEKHEVASGFTPNIVEPFAFSVPDEQDPAVKTVLQENGYAFDRNSVFNVGGGCMVSGTKAALFYKPGLTLDKQA
jgi:hypothetical protein